MGKVGSTTIYHALMPYASRLGSANEVELEDFESRHENVYHLHSTKTLSDFLNKSDEEIIVISLVREFLSRNVSGFFNYIGRTRHLKYLFRPKRRREKIVDKLVLEYCRQARSGFDRYYDWFDTFVEAVKIDIFAEPFNKEKGCQVYTAGRTRLMMIRLEDLDNLQEELGVFLGLPELRFANRNISEKKWFGDLYKDFKKRWIPEPEEVAAYMNSKVMRHFYTEVEIQRFLRRAQLSC
jgi:hypothetical protein